MDLETQFLLGPEGRRLAYKANAGEGTGLIWLGGFRSDMSGGKATRLHAWAQTAGRPFLRFDYSGHGESDGDFADGTIGAWIADALAMLDGPAAGARRILVGSSMGAWIALLCARARPDQVAGLLLIAPAPDFTDDLMWERFPKAVRAEIETKGMWFRPSPYDDGPYPITKQLIDEGRDHLILEKGLSFAGPVRILQGMADEDVPWRHALRLIDALEAADVQMTLVKDGDHRLSRDADLDLLEASAGAICGTVDAR